MANHCEKVTTRTLKNIDNLFYMKLHNNPLAHQKTPSDYIAFPDNNPLRYFIECKRVIVKKRASQSTFVFDRLTQKTALLDLENRCEHNRAYVIILFWKGRFKKSDCYAIPINDYVTFEHSWHKKSIRVDEASQEWPEYKLVYKKGSMYDFSAFLDTSQDRKKYK